MQLLKFSDLKARQIVRSRMTLRRWIAENGFPAAIKLGPNSVAWSENDVNAWLASRNSRVKMNSVHIAGRDNG